MTFDIGEPSTLWQLCNVAHVLMASQLETRLNRLIFARKMPDLALQ